MDAAGKDGRRALKIKCGSVSRLRKEIGLYEAETARENARVEAMRAAAACPHDVKQAENCAAESAMMIPDCRMRLEAALADLQAVVVRLHLQNPRVVCACACALTALPRAVRCAGGARRERGRGGQ
jgi:tubulin-specific chaperone A